MSQGADAPSPPAAAWQPLTFAGVAAFASARLGRLLLAGAVTAAIFAGGVVWFLARDYCPVVLQAIEKMPETARLSGGKLMGVPDVLISETKRLAIVVTPESSADLGQGADAQIQLRQTDFCVTSIFRPDWGLDFDYGSGVVTKLDRGTLEPWWGAWEPVILTGAGVGVVIGLLIVWAVVATVYMGAAKFISWFADRKLSWSGAWRLCFASMAPGTLVLTFGLFLYGWQTIELAHLSFFYLAHLVMGWVYVIGAVLALPRLFPRVKEKNPFTG